MLTGRRWVFDVTKSAVSESKSLHSSSQGRAITMSINANISINIIIVYTGSSSKSFYFPQLTTHAFLCWHALLIRYATFLNISSKKMLRA